MAERRLHLFTAAGVAEELALRDAEMLRRITPEEIRNGAWMHEKASPNKIIIITYIRVYLRGLDWWGL